MRVSASYTDDFGTAEALDSPSFMIHGAASSKSINVLAFSWKAHTLLDSVDVTIANARHGTNALGSTSFSGITDTSVAVAASRNVPANEVALTDQAVNVQDAIAILKMIVGLDVNGAGKPLSPYQALAADFDGNGAINVSDAVGVLRHVVGLAGPGPTWHFVDEASIAVAAIAPVSPGPPPPTNLTLDPAATAPVHAGLVGYLSGDVDGSFVGLAGTGQLDVNYLTALVTSHPGLSLTQFGIYAS